MSATEESRYTRLSGTAQQARTLYIAERLARVPASAPRSGTAGDRFAGWRRMAPFRDDSCADNLRTLGLEPEQLQRLLDEDPADTAARLPGAFPAPWTVPFTEAHETYGDPDGAPHSLPPLMRLAEPLVRRARARLREGLRADAQADGIEGLADALCADIPLQQLDMTLGPAVILEVNLARVGNSLAGTTARERFASFTRRLTTPGYRAEFWDRYPVLARRVTETMEQWVATRLRFARHLRDDLAEIGPALTGARWEERVPAVAAVGFGQGDTHKGGQSVARVDFADGSAVVYKPRSLGVDTAFNALIDRFGQDSGLTLRTPRVLDRGSHGWVELVRPAPCASPEEAAAFYRRLGALLSLVHVLNGTDLHHENLIASGAHPVLIDLEALFHPAGGSTAVWATGTPATADPAAEALRGSVFTTGLLPGKTVVGQEPGRTRTTDLSGINGSAGQPWLVPVLVPQDLGTDRIRLVRREVEVPGADNRPRTAEGDLINPGEFTAEVLAGFGTGYAWLQEHRDELLAPGGLLDGFAGHPVRYLHRATYVYGQVLTESFHPDFAHDALDREQSVARLCSGWQGAPHRDLIVRSELDALLAGDIPFFQVLPEARVLLLDNGRSVPDFLAEAPLDVVRGRLRRLDRGDRERQEWIIAAAFADLAPSGSRPATAGSRRRAGSSGTVPAGLPERALAAAEEIGDRLMRLACVAGDRVGWLGTRTVAAEVSDIEPVGADLYAGTSGIGLFLRALGRVGGRRRYTDFADLVAADVVRRVTAARGTEPGAAADAASVGAFAPDLSALFLLSHESGTFGSAGSAGAYAAVRDTVLARLDAAVAQDEQLDVFGGSAGCVLVLLAALAVDGDPRLPAVARRAAEHLLARVERTPDGAAWRNASVRGERPITGLAHGTSGIVMALSRLADLLPDERYRAAAASALDYEAATFDAGAGNWPDLREGAAERFRSAWCHGAAGVALSRFGLLGAPELRDGAVRDVTAALRATPASRGNDSVCHGDLGNLELLLLAERHGLAEPGELAVRLDACLRRADHEGWRCGSPDGAEVPGLFTGLAGIGYQLLRLTAPDAVPSVLLLEAPRAARISGAT
ncbi:type 2 lanthipeptide synthetase LanM family protein [Streptomyces sp. enrichment culture]|uniref:type 2 lanthipeptide synthetase LanM family protein n=1 Tax=Streptomyces sp. enrichment culture TaxID=1795815 RepID=UPI003F5610A0